MDKKENSHSVELKVCTDIKAPETPKPENPQKIQNRRLILNIGGVRHEVLRTALERLPNSRLGRLGQCATDDDINELCDDYRHEDNEYYFNRNPRHFGPILDFYISGKLHSSDSTCVMTFSAELEYWAIDELYLESCCRHKYIQKKERLLDEMRKEAQTIAQNDHDQFGSGRSAHYQKLIWQLFERPHMSCLARTLAYVSIFAIIVSIIVQSLNTVDSLQDYNFETQEPEYNHLLARLEAICIAWFTLEYMLRLMSAPNKCQFFRGGLNLIDFFANFSYFVPIFLETEKSSNLFLDFSRIAQILRIIRIFRIMTLARYSPGLQSLGYTLKKSYKELAHLILFIGICIVIFSSLLYFAEKDEVNTKFRSIPSTFWWGIITMTTVGYGDVVPTTPFGKVIASACCICGVLVISLPIPTIVKNFRDFYKNQLRRENALKRKEILDKVKINSDAFLLDKVSLRCRLLGDGSSGLTQPVLYSGANNSDESHAINIESQTIPSVPLLTPLIDTKADDK